MFLLFRYLATKGSENLLELINNPGAEKLLTAKEPILLLVPIESIGGMFIIFILFNLRICLINQKSLLILNLYIQ